MVSLDTVKIEVPIDFLKFYQKDEFYKNLSLDNEYVYSDDEVFKGHIKFLGLKRIEIKKIPGVVHIETSGKILKQKYFEGLTINTLEEYFDNINDTGLIEFDKRAIDYTRVLRCDVVNNLKVSSDNLTKYFYSLSLCAFNHNYLVSNYEGSVVFTKQVKSYKRRMIFYDKYKEIQRDREILKSDAFSKQDIERFKNVLRCEQNFTSFKTMRQAFKVQDIKLVDILKSKEKVNYNTFNEITNEKSLFFDNVKSLREYKKFCYVDRLCKDFNYDFKEIKNFLMLFVSKRQTYKELKIIKEFVNKLDKFKKASEQVEEIRELLKAA